MITEILKRDVVSARVEVIANIIKLAEVNLSVESTERWCDWSKDVPWDVSLHYFLIDTKL